MLTLPALGFRKFMNLVISFYIQSQWKKKKKIKSITNEKHLKKSLDVNGNNLKEKKKKALKSLTVELILIAFKIPAVYHVARA